MRFCSPLVFSALTSLTLALIGSPAVAREPTYDSPTTAAKNEDFGLQGEYVGQNTAMQIVAVGDGEFQCVIYGGGLPGAGWDRQPPRRVDADYETAESLVKSMRLARTERKSPTLGAQPPAGAIVLFDGSAESLQKNWDAGAKRTDDGLLQQGATTRQKFQDFTLHLEFRTPFQPKDSGQGRGNSGVYYQGRYETQILDSFGLEGQDNECGGIYELHRPSENLCFPPLTWQTYDVDFTAAKYDAQGKKTADAKITVRLNGVVVHRDAALARATRASILGEGADPGPIHLQDHGNPVRYRNIWVIPRDSTREAKRPILPALERLYAAGVDVTADGATAGRVLINELNCTQCHAGEIAGLSPRTPPKLNQIGNRIRFDHIVEWISQPHESKPGTWMPDMLAGKSADQRQQTAHAIASYLAGEDQVIDQRGYATAARRGEELYHSLGCVACHPSFNGPATPIATTIPFGPLAQKYTLGSLAAFLQNPFELRPSGRMPHFGLNPVEAQDIATFLLRDVVMRGGGATMTVQVFHGTWQSLPDFSELKPVAQHETNELSVAITDRRDQFALRFETYLKVGKTGRFTFYLGSDDGSRLLVDGKELIKHDGVHPHSEKSKSTRLEAGTHQVVIEYFEYMGEESLSAEVEGPGFARTSLDVLGQAAPDAPPPEPFVAQRLQPSAELVNVGKAAFEQLGCIACHADPRNPDAKGTVKQPAPALVELKAAGGCLSEQPRAGLPHYDLTALQKQQIAAALDAMRGKDKSKVDAKAIAKDAIHLQLVAMNCFACHVRDGVGGPEGSRTEFFKTKIPEMGEEGRLPPILTGIGDKLNDDYLKKVLNIGADLRPYMLTKMPGFGNEHLPQLAKQFATTDRIESDSRPNTDEALTKVHANGRQLVGDTGMSCIKCHTFNGKGTPGIQAIDLLSMTNRLREDWFHRYLLDPQKYRPGTRMPTSYQNGKSTVTAIYKGDPTLQTDAVWRYLEQGKSAKEPSGLAGAQIVLKPEQRPIIYRNFIEGLTPRAIAVGYPAGVHQAWDAGRMSLKFLWKGAFIDAAKHWEGRGPGNQSPLGDELLEIESECMFATLDGENAEWPTTSARERNYRFLGYRLDRSGIPTFRYQTPTGWQIEETLVPMASDSTDGKSVVQRKLVAKGTGQPIFARIASSNAIESLGDGRYRIGNSYTLRLLGANNPQVRSIAGHMELIVRLEEGNHEIIEEIAW